MLVITTGLEPSPPDIRDYMLTSFLPPLTVAIPDDYLGWLPFQTPVEYQEGLGACVSFSGTGQAEGYNTKEYGQPINLSAQFGYDEAKKNDGMPNVEGTHFRAFYTVMKNIGCCEEQYLPYEGRFPPLGTPKDGYLENAAQYKITAYAQVDVTKDAIKRAIFQNGPITLAIKVHDSFADIPKGGIAIYPSGKYQGGHGILAPAYTKLGVVCKNSWSEYWGGVVIEGKLYKGYCIIPWTVLESISLGEAWSITDLIIRKKPWTDWPELELESAWATKNSGVLKGYPDGSFHPLDNVTMHQANTIAERLKFQTLKESKEWWSTPALRGWIHQNWPQYTFLEERWDENITRFQFALIIGRYLKENNLAGTLMV